MELATATFTLVTLIPVDFSRFNRIATATFLAMYQSAFHYNINSLVDIISLYNYNVNTPNIQYMILNQGYTLDSALTEYYKNGVSSRFSSFIDKELNNSPNTAITYINTQYFVVTWPIYDPTDTIWKNFLNTAIIPLEDAINIPNVDVQRMRDAYWNYLQSLANMEK